jgi:replication factor C subunit 2/4
MASFFDIKARKLAAATNGSSAQKDDKSKQPARIQPWVEK